DVYKRQVLLPEISSEADRFRVEYGTGVRAGSWAPGDVWPAYEAVWHLGEDPADPEPQYRDSSGHGRAITNPANDRIPSDAMGPGIVGRAPRFAEGRELQISDSEWSGSNIGGRFTLEAWVQYEERPPRDHRTIVRKLGAYDLVGSRDRTNSLENPAWTVRDDSEPRPTVALNTNWNEGPGVWNYAAATFERDAKRGQVRTVLYLDGVEVAREESSDYQPAQNAADFRIGSNLTAAVDEVRVSFEVRPPAWFELQDRSMRDELLQYGDPTPLE
ncbi:MAG: LamG domain-containing protein, partial [Nannocystaceae bacterium]|nr:LamG domain-containing protein [Nannocystaceae bacterium]